MAIEILTADEVGELIRLSANRVVALARRGEIPYLTIDGHVRFDARDIENWLRYQRCDAPVLPSKVRDVSPAPESDGDQISRYLRSETGMVLGLAGTSKKPKE